MSTGNFLDILILFGSIQGFISAFVLFKKKKQTPNHILGFILIIASMACLNIYLFLVLEGEIPFVLGLLEKIVPLIIIMPLGPLIYFYVKSSAGVPFSFRKERIHFLPITLDLAPNLISLGVIILYLLGFVDSIESEGLASFNESYEKYVDIPRWIATSIYVGLAMKFLSTGQLAAKKKAWLRQFLIVFGVFQTAWLLHLIPYILPTTSDWLLGTVSWYPIYLPLTILVYWLGISGLIQSRNLTSNTKDQKELKNAILVIDKLMKKERLFLNPTLSLTTLVEKSGIDQKTVSAALNQCLGKSFNEYVNTFRVEEVQRKMRSDKYNHFSITGIALESGFNSQATFQRAFKSLTQMTPKSYRASIQSKTSQI